jgi:hypothetical protein
LEPRRRGGVSDYLATFILIGVAMAGSGIVYSATSAYSASARGPAVSLIDGGISQGSYSAVEKVGVFNPSTVDITSFILSTVGGPGTASYCYSLFDPENMTAVSSTCPAMVLGLGAVDVTYPLLPGEGVLVEIMVTGGSFTVGSSCTLTVTASSGAEQTLAVQVVPA